MQVAHEVDQKAQRLTFFLGIDSRRMKGRDLVQNGLRDATFREYAELHNFHVRCSERYIDVMPRRSFRTESAYVIRPRRGVGDWIGSAVFAVRAQGRIDRSVTQNLFDHC